MPTFPRAIRPVRRLVRREGQRLQAQPHRPMDLAVKGGHSGRRMLQDNRHRSESQTSGAGFGPTGSVGRRPGTGSPAVASAHGVGFFRAATRFSCTFTVPKTRPRPEKDITALVAGGRGQGHPQKTAGRRGTGFPHEIWPGRCKTGSPLAVWPAGPYQGHLPPWPFRTAFTSADGAGARPESSGLRCRCRNARVERTHSRSPTKISRFKNLNSHLSNIDPHTAAGGGGPIYR